MEGEVWYKVPSIILVGFSMHFIILFRYITLLPQKVIILHNMLPPTLHTMLFLIKNTILILVHLKQNAVHSVEENAVGRAHATHDKIK